MTFSEAGELTIAQLQLLGEAVERSRAEEGAMLARIILKSVLPAMDGRNTPIYEEMVERLERIATGIETDL